jgi:hypothetical protein
MTSRRKGGGFISSWRPEHPRFTGCDEINQSPILLGRPIASAALNSHQMARLCRRSIKRRQIHGQSEVGRQARDGALYLHHQAPDVAAMDLFVVPTIGFKLLYAFVIVSARPQRPRLDQRHCKPDSRRDHARQLTEAFPWGWRSKISYPRSGSNL